MKTLATCKPSEFLKQTNLIRKSVEKWLTDTDIINIRKRMPILEVAPANADDDEKEMILASNKKKRDEQVKKNLSAILDAIMEDHPDETLEILALCCFIDPENADEYPVRDYLLAINELLSDEAVIGFFGSLARLGQTNG